MVLAKLNISSGKKHWSQLALVVGGVILCGVFFARESLVILYGVIFVSSLFFSFASPLNDAVYSDLIDRIKSEKLYLVGLAKANSSIAYIASPIVMGMVADSTDYYTTFGSLGVIAVVIGSFLLLVTPRKLRLPQAALSNL